MWQWDQVYLPRLEMPARVTPLADKNIDTNRDCFLVVYGFVKWVYSNCQNNPAKIYRVANGVGK